MVLARLARARDLQPQAADEKRWEETNICLDLLTGQADRALDLRARQLYHDREEITVFARCLK